MYKHWLASLYVGALLISLVITSVFHNLFLYVRTGNCILLINSLFLVVLFSIGVVRKTKLNIQTKFTYIDLFVALYTIYFFLQYIFSPHSNLIPQDLLIHLVTTFVYIFFRILFSNNSNAIRNVIITILVFGFLQCLYAVLQYLLIFPTLFSSYNMGGTFGNPGDLANVLTVCYALAIGWLPNHRNQKSKWWLVGLIILIVSTIVIANARTAWVAVTVVTIYGAQDVLKSLITRLKQSKFILYATVLIMLVVGLFCAMQLFKYKQPSSSGRIFIYKICTELILDKPILGHGYDTFVPTYTNKQADYFKLNPNDIKNGLLADDNVFAFNDYLQITIEYGLLGLMLFLIPIILVIYGSMNQKEKYSGYKKVIIAPIIGILVCMLFSYPIQNPVLYLILFIFLSIASNNNSSSIYTIHYKNERPLIIYISIICLSIMGLLYAAYNINAGLNWKNSYADFSAGKSGYLEAYSQNMITLKNDKHYLYHFGAMLYSSGEYEKCIDHYESYYSYCLNSNMLMILAESYERNGDYIKAEENYQRASEVKPHLFVPRHKLFKLYNKTGQSEKAYQIATTINQMPIKVYSEMVQKIKSEINEFLLTIN